MDLDEIVLVRPYRLILPLSLMALFFGLFAFLVAWVALPRVEEMKWVQDKPTITLLDQRGTKIGTFGNAFGEFYASTQLPDHVVHAVLSTEDRRFYSHWGIDPKGLARAIYVNLRRGRLVQGGSTLTQQLAKNLYFSSDRSLTRKLKEAVMAIKLERKFSKDQLLSLYLNRVYFGAGVYGVDAAANRFFGKSALDLTVYEAATLAGLLKAPSRYNPANSLDRAEKRTAVVLQAMQDAGYLSQRDVSDLRAQGRLTLEGGKARAGRAKAPYFADWIMAQLDAYVGTPQEDLLVYTTLDLDLQKQAREALNASLQANTESHDVDQAALVSFDAAGGVKALVGGRSYKASQFNRATQALRQPGSAFKLFVYLAALEEGLDLQTSVYDGPINVGDWRPQNYSRRFYGDVDMETAFKKSLNPASVVLAESAGRQNVQNMAYRMGISTDLTDHPSLSLGASEGSLLELTNAYTIVANGGKHVVPHGIKRVTDAEGSLIYERDVRSFQVVKAEIADKMRYLLGSVIRGGTGERANREGVLGGKTGTSSNNRDAVFVGYTNQHVTGVWVGNDSGAPMTNVTGGSLPVDIFLKTHQLEGVARNAAPLQRPENTSSIFSDGIY